VLAPARLRALMVAAVAVALAQLLQLKVKVSHSSSFCISSSWLSFAPGYPLVVVGV